MEMVFRMPILNLQLTDNAWSQGGYRIDVFSIIGKEEDHCKTMLRLAVHRITGIGMEVTDDGKRLSP